MKNILLHSTHVNSMSFSDSLVTVWFDVSVLILHFDGNFSDNLIFHIFCKLVLCENKSIWPFSGFFVRDLFGWSPTVSAMVSDAHGRIISTPAESVHLLKVAKQIYSDQFTEIMKK